MAAVISSEEHARLLDLYAYDILDSEAEEAFDAIVAVASQIAEVPISLISLIDLKRQWFKARVGLEVQETHRDISFCNHAIRQDLPFIVEDTLKDKRFAENPLVLDSPHLRFYAGFPLVTTNGNKIGTLCVLHQQPHQLTAQQKDALGKLADQVINLFELRIKNKYLEQLSGQLTEQRNALNTLVDNQRRIISVLAHDTRGPLSSMEQLLSFNEGDDVANLELLPVIHLQLKNTLELLDNLVHWGMVNLYSKEQKEYDLEDAIQEAFKPYAERAKEKRIRLLTEVNRNANLPLSKDIFVFILRNLFQNAVKFMEDGVIKATIHMDEMGTRIRVMDEGIGIPPAIREHLFMKRIGSRTGTRLEQGSGIGLLLVNDFVVQSGGNITVESEPGKGTTFSIQFPPAPLPKRPEER